MSRKQSPTQARRTNKELIEQLNAWEIEGEAVAIHRLQSRDYVITIDNEQACRAQLANTKWLETFGARAQVKRQEFIVLAHGVQVYQVQKQEQAIVDIYKQNPKFLGIVDILQMSFSRKLLKSSYKINLLIILVIELEQTNYIIDIGLIYRYKLYNYKLYNRNYIVT